MHFGLPCKSWSAWQRINPRATRTIQNPAGCGTNQGEVEGNLLTERVLELCRLLQAAGRFWSIEKPASSLVWHYPGVKSLVEKQFLVDFDQCSFGLEVGGELIRKSTRVATNLRALSVLCHNFSRDHQHRRCGDKIRTSNGTVDVSQLAGAYPRALCELWAEACAGSFGASP